MQADYFNYSTFSPPPLDDTVLNYPNDLSNLRIREDDDTFHLELSSTLINIDTNDIQVKPNDIDYLNESEERDDLENSKAVFNKQVKTSVNSITQSQIEKSYLYEKRNVKMKAIDIGESRDLGRFLTKPLEKDIIVDKVVAIEEKLAKLEVNKRIKSFSKECHQNKSSVSKPKHRYNTRNKHKEKNGIDNTLQNEFDLNELPVKKINKSKNSQETEMKKTHTKQISPPNNYLTKEGNEVNVKSQTKQTRKYETVKKHLKNLSTDENLPVRRSARLKENSTGKKLD